MAELERHDFDVVVYKKDQIILPVFQMGFLADNFHHRMDEMEKKMIDRLEKVVIDNGYMTTYAGIHMMAFPTNHAKPVALLIVYKPTLNYKVFTSAGQIRDELKLLGSKVVV